MVHLGIFEFVHYFFHFFNHFFKKKIDAQVLLDLAQLSVPLEPSLRGRTGFYQKLFQKLRSREPTAPEYDPTLAERLIEEIWRGRCAKTGNSLTLTLTRFDKSRDCSWDNMILLTGAEAKKHEALASIDDLQPNYLDYCRGRLALAKSILHH